MPDTSPKPRALLVYANPAITASPVPPYGMERVAQVMRLAGCEVVLLAPFIEEDPLAALNEALAQGADLVGFSVRNIDDALVVRGEVGAGDIDTNDYLPAVRPLVMRAVEALGAARVILGGAGLSAGAAPILRDLGATRAVRGPAEDLMYGMARGLVLGMGPVLPTDDPRVVELDRVTETNHQSPPMPRGAGAKMPGAWPTPTPRMAEYLRLTLARGGRVPVSISTGCDRRCAFCVEARFAAFTVKPRPVEHIVAEVMALERAGVKRLWLGCSELNAPDARHAKAVLRALQGRGLDLAVFLQPAPMDDELLDLIEGAGLDPTALSYEFGHLDDTLLRAGAGPATRRSIERLAELYLKRGYRTLGGSVLLGAHPQEDDTSLGRALDLARQLDAAFPDGLGLSYACGGRVYPETRLADWIAEDWDAARPHLYTLPGQPIDETFVRPVVYSRPAAPRALLRQVRAALAGCRGHIGPMNAEAPASDAQLHAERLVNRGIWRHAQGQSKEAEALFVEAESRWPGHLEALAQLGLLRANTLFDFSGARSAFQKLLGALPEADPRRGEIQAALTALRGSG
ncbi:MAG: radical SAM protein [Deltaproteobacteria bacterium]|nr:radical SAM protein [Deltaproteobacteria bacterium]